MKVGYLTWDGGRSTAYLEVNPDSVEQGVPVAAVDKYTERATEVFPLAGDWVEVAPEDRLHQ